MDQNYLIPANTKKGQLILGYFTPLDLIIFGSGLLVTLLLVMILPMDNTLFAVIAVAPGIVCSFLVLPVAYYHNIRQLIMEIYKYFTSRNRFIWKGWCFINESESESK